MKLIYLNCVIKILMGHFRDAASLCFKTRPSAKTFLVKMILYYHENKTHFHKKGFAPGLVLRVRVFGTRKWPIVERTSQCSHLSREYITSPHNDQLPVGLDSSVG